MINGRSITDNSLTATCMRHSSSIQCTITLFHDTTFLASSYVPLPDVVMYVGWFHGIASRSIVNVQTGEVKSYIYTAGNMKTLTLSQIQSPPAFVGSFIAGTAIRATATPANYIITGMVRTDNGMLRAIMVMPASGDIRNEADLVNAMELEYVGPDAFVAGGLQLAGELHLNAYVQRANALYSTVSYCVRYRSLSSGRRVLSAVETAASQSVVRGMVLVGTTLFMIVDHTVNNVTSLTVLKTSAVDGAILQQVHVSAPNSTSLYCTDITMLDQHLSVVCTIRTASPQSLLLAVDFALSFAVLPSGFKRTESSLFSTEVLAFRSVPLLITQTNAVISMVTSNVSIADQSPTTNPSPAPSCVSSAQPSSEPSVSARPTSKPSTSGPTSTHKPSAEPTLAPTGHPSVHLTNSPSVRSTVQPTTHLTVPPSFRPSPLPTVTPSKPPHSARPTSRAASGAPTTSPNSDVEDSGNSIPSYVVGASVGGGLGLLLIGFVLLRYYQHNQEEKKKDKRRLEYFQQQALLAEQERVNQGRFMQQHKENEEPDEIGACAAGRSNSDISSEYSSSRGSSGSSRIDGSCDSSGGSASGSYSDHDPSSSSSRSSSSSGLALHSTRRVSSPPPSPYHSPSHSPNGLRSRLPFSLHEPSHVGSSDYAVSSLYSSDMDD